MPKGVLTEEVGRDSVYVLHPDVRLLSQLPLFQSQMWKGKCLSAFVELAFWVDDRNRAVEVIRCWTNLKVFGQFDIPETRDLIGT